MHEETATVMRPSNCQPLGFDNTVLYAGPGGGTEFARVHSFASRSRSTLSLLKHRLRRSGSHCGRDPCPPLLFRRSVHVAQPDQGSEKLCNSPLVVSQADRDRRDGPQDTHAALLAVKGIFHRRSFGLAFPLHNFKTELRSTVHMGVHGSPIWVSGQSRDCYLDCAFLGRLAARLLTCSVDAIWLWRWRTLYLDITLPPHKVPPAGCTASPLQHPP